MLRAISQHRRTELRKRRLGGRKEAFMEALAILILLALGGWAVYAVRSAKRKKGGCGCGCSGCNGCERKK